MPLGSASSFAAKGWKEERSIGGGANFDNERERDGDGDEERDRGDDLLRLVVKGRRGRSGLLRRDDDDGFHLMVPPRLLRDGGEERVGGGAKMNVCGSSLGLRWRV